MTLKRGYYDISFTKMQILLNLYFKSLNLLVNNSYDSKIVLPHISIKVYIWFTHSIRLSLVACKSPASFLLIISGCLESNYLLLGMQNEPFH